MSARLVQPGTGDRRALVVLYLAGSQVDAAVRAALGPGPCIVAYDDPDGEPLFVTTEWALARADVVAFVVVALVGWSAGCLRGVRQRLREGANPSAVLAIDGLHASLPPAAWQIDPWQRYAARARVGERLLVLSATQQIYTERLTYGAYLCTLNGLRRVTGWPLEEAGPLDAPAHHADGELHAYVYRSAAIDGAAHVAQQRVALPELLRLHLAPWLEQAVLAAPGVGEGRNAPNGPQAPLAILRRGSRGPLVKAWQRRLLELGHGTGTPDGAFGPATEAATRAFQAAAGLAVDGAVGRATRDAAARARTVQPAAAKAPAATELGRVLLEKARADLGQCEQPSGSNDGPVVRRFFEGTGLEPPKHWCAAGVRYWLQAAAAELGVEPPIRASVGVKATMERLEAAGRWVPLDVVRADPSCLRPGMLIIWHRGPPGARTGHIGVIAEIGAERLLTVEANSGPQGDRVAEMCRRLDDPRLLGFGWVD